MLTRRTILTGAPALALMPAPMPAHTSPQATRDHIERIGDELAIFMDDWTNGQFKAVIYPKSLRMGGLIFMNLKA